MSAITIESDLVHYEVLGRGRPVIFVHGWLGSWRYWVPTMQYLSAKYRVYALDLWGFGDSGKDTSKYTLQGQVQLLFGFFERLGIPKAALIGHSLGAAVCLSFARQYPDRAYRMMLISPPLFDQGTGEDARVEPTPPAASPAPAVPSVSAGPAAPASVATATGTAQPVPAAGTAPAPAPSTVPAAGTTTGTVPPSAAPVNPPAAPAAVPTGAASTPQPPAPSVSTPSTAAAPAAPPAASPATSTVTPASVPASTSIAVPAPSPAATPAAAPPSAAAQSEGASAGQNASMFSSSAETLPRNPFRSRGETPEEILARLRARSTGVQPQAAPTAAPATPPSGPASTTPSSAPAEPPRPSAPVLPTGIAKPILPLSSPAAPTPAGGAQSAKTSVNPLLSILTGVKPSALLLKHARQDVPDWDSLRAEVDKTDEKALLQSAQSFDTFNMALELRRVTAPTLLLHGEDDGLLTPPPLELLRRIEASKQSGQFLSMIEPGLKHFPMIEITAKFNRLLVDFLEAPDLSNVQFKDQWKRTIR